MDSVPPIFMESVCILLDRESLLESGKIQFTWGEVFAATSEKIHTLRVVGAGKTGKIYAAAQPLLSDDYLRAVPLDSVNLKFITNFCIKSYCYNLPSSYKEITLDQVEKLARFIKPIAEGRQPLRYNPESSKNTSLIAPTWIGRKLLSIRLPVDSVSLWINPENSQDAVEEFFKNAGPLFHIYVYCYRGVLMKQSTIDAMIDKFLPVDDGSFHLSGDVCLTRDQLERLVLKCEMSDKKVEIGMCPEGFTNSSKVTDHFDFHKHKYSTKNIEGENTGKIYRITAVRDGANLEVRVRQFTSGSLEWEWCDPVPQGRASDSDIILLS